MMVAEMQTGRIADVRQTSQQIRVEPLDQWGRPYVPVEADLGPTDLQLLADAAHNACVVVGARAPDPPWLSPLPDILPIDAVDDVSAPDLISLGLVDLPDVQQQTPLVLELARAGPCLVVGGAGSGRTTALMTAVAAAAHHRTSDSLEIYVIDCAGGGLQPVADLPQCASFLSREDFDAAERLIERLASISTGQHADYGSASSTDPQVPTEQPSQKRLMVVLDGWEGFVAASEEHDGGRTVDTLIGFLRDAASIEMTVLIAGDRTVLVPRLAGVVSRRYVFKLSDRADYALAGIPPHRVPLRMPPGRAIRGEDHAEVQFAILGRDASRAAQWRAVTDIAAATPARTVRPTILLRPLPRRVQLADIRPSERGRPTLGVGGDNAEPIYVDLFACAGAFLVTGPPRSGRTTVLTMIGEQLNPAELEILVVAPARSELTRFAQSAGLAALSPDAAESPLTEEPRRRRIVLVDDAETFLDTPVGDALTDAVRRGDSRQIAVVAARSDDLAVAYRGLLFEVRRGQCGLLLQPRPVDGELLGVRLRRSSVTTVPGRGVLVGDLPRLTGLARSGAAIPIQMAVP
jgi:DNA segregation ATPase FtsK/SpoIIIE, S-DNA-T family